MLEPLASFGACPEAHRLQVTRDAMGLDHVYVGGQEIVTVSLGKLGTPGSDMADLAHSSTYDEAQPGGFDPNVRLADMDLEGIDAAVLYPSLGLNFWSITDPDAAASLARAYNDWLAQYCAADPRRLYGSAMVPWQSTDAAIAELRRAHDELGFRVVFLRPNPCLGRTIAHPQHERFWEVAEELDITIGIHEGSSNTIETLGADRKPFNPLVLHAMSHAFEQMLACAQLITRGHGTPSEFAVRVPRSGRWLGAILVVASRRAGRWFRGLLPRHETHAERVLRAAMPISFEIDEPSLPALAPLIGTDRIVWGSDYPHHDSTFPGATRKLRATIASLPGSAQERVLGTNATDCYRLP